MFLPLGRKINVRMVCNQIAPKVIQLMNVEMLHAEIMLGLRPFLTVGVLVPTKLLWEPPQTFCPPYPYGSDFRQRKAPSGFGLAKKSQDGAFLCVPTFFSYAGKTGTLSPTAICA